MSQANAILEYLKTGKTLTVLEAIEKLNVYALSQRVGEINKTLKYGRIVSEMIKTSTRKHIARYKFLKDGELF